MPDSIGPIRNGNLFDTVLDSGFMIQSDRYGMETFLAPSMDPVNGFNRTDTEWKPLPEQVLLLWFDSIGPIRNGNLKTATIY